jgi:hypothetical protein
VAYPDGHSLHSDQPIKRNESQFLRLHRQHRRRFDRLADGARGEPLLTQSAADIADDATVLSTVVRMGGAEAIPQRPYPLRMKRASKVPVRLDLRTLAARTNCSWAQWSPSREVPLNQRRP